MTGRGARLLRNPTRASDALSSGSFTYNGSTFQKSQTRAHSERGEPRVSGLGAFARTPCPPLGVSRG